VNIYIFDEQNSLSINSTQVESIVSAVIHFEGQLVHEVSVHIVDTPTISALHAEYFDDPSTTDCISFPIDSPEEKEYRVLGEVFVCPETAITYANKHEVDPYRETTLYIVHGLLHLMDYDDYPEVVELMREAEKRHMGNLRHLNLCLTKGES